MNDTSQPSQFEWVRQGDGRVPLRAVPGGREHGEVLLVCRGEYKGGMHPGKLVDGACNIGWGGAEIRLTDYEVLTCTAPERLRWVHAIGPIPRGAVSGGREQGRDLYICRGEYKGGMHPGKLVDGACNIGWGGAEIRLTDYEVLTALPVREPSKADRDAYARAHGWSDSDYPYHKHPDGCSGPRLRGSLGRMYRKATGRELGDLLVPDGWFYVDFTGACNNHDRCYTTLGASKAECDERFRQDLRAAAKKAIVERWYHVWDPPKTKLSPPERAFFTAIAHLIPGTQAFLAPPIPRLGVVTPAPDPAGLARAYALCDIYYEAVRDFGQEPFNEGQENARQYAALMEAMSSG